MPLLTVEPKSKPHILKVELDGNTHARLTRYCAFTNNGSENSVIREALKYVFDKDDEFLTWEKNPENGTPATRPASLRKKAPATAAPGTLSVSSPEPNAAGKGK
jgi:hypothetical protein